MKKLLLMTLSVLVSFSNIAIANDLDKVTANDALSSELTLYTDKALVQQSFSNLPNENGKLILDGFGKAWDESSLALEYQDGVKKVFPEKIEWQAGEINRNYLYSSLVGKPVELMGGGLNVLVKGKLLSYNAGLGVASGNNGREYIIDWNDPQGVRLASQTAILKSDYADHIVAEFGQQKPTGKLELSYLSPSINYVSHYRLTMDAKGLGLLQREIIIHNKSAIDYHKAKIRLVSGENKPMPVMYSNSLSSLRAQPESTSSNYIDKRLGELLVTQLPGKTTLDSHSTLKLTQYKQGAILFKKQYVLDVYGRSFGSKIANLKRPQLELSFKANADLPAGQVALYTRSGDGSMILSGSAWLPETIKNDEVRLSMGPALAVRVKLLKVDSQAKAGSLQSKWKATIYNDQKEAITFILNDRENRLLKLSNVEGGKLSITSMIKVTVPAGGKKEINYTADYERSSHFGE